MKCISQVGRTFSILKEHFDIILKQKSSQLADKIDILTAQIEMQHLNRVEDRGHLKKNFEKISLHDKLMSNVEPAKTNVDYNNDEEIKKPYALELTDEDKKNLKIN